LRAVDCHAPDLLPGHRRVEELPVLTAVIGAVETLIGPGEDGVVVVRMNREAARDRVSMHAEHWPGSQPILTFIDAAEHALSHRTYQDCPSTRHGSLLVLDARPAAAGQDTHAAIDVILLAPIWAKSRAGSLREALDGWRGIEG